MQRPNRGSEKSEQVAAYVWEVHSTVSLHCFLDLAQGSVVPPRQLETQGPVGGDDGLANELHNTIGHIVSAATVLWGPKTLCWLQRLVPYLKEFLHHLLWSVSKEDVEVEDPSDRPVGHSGGGLESHL